MSKRIRTFVAVPFVVEPSLKRVLSELGNMGSAVRAATVESLHVTLKFLGDTDLEDVPAVSDVIRAAVENHAICDCPIVGLGAFPNASRPSVVWAGLGDTETLEAIARTLNRELGDLGFPRENRKFQPHLTLARVQHRPPPELAELLRQHAATPFGVLSVDDVKLYQSELLPQGPRYTSLATFELGDG